MHEESARGVSTGGGAPPGASAEAGADALPVPGGLPGGDAGVQADATLPGGGAGPRGDAGAPPSADGPADAQADASTGAGAGARADTLPGTGALSAGDADTGYLPSADTDAGPRGETQASGAYAEVGALARGGACAGGEVGSPPGSGAGAGASGTAGARAGAEADGGAGPVRVRDGVRFAFGTLSVVPVRVGRWDRRAARAGMLAAPLVGGVVGVVAAGCGGLLVALGASPLLAAVGAVAAPAVLTRALHLDGLADTADGLGSGKPAEEALRVMKQSDIGPFGVVTLLLVLLAQVGSAAACYTHGWVYGGVAAVLAAVTARTALTLACRGGVPPARPGGLGAAVAGTVPCGVALAYALTCVCLAAACGLPFGGLTALRTACAAVLAFAAAEAVLRRAVTRFGGVTGDVFGATAEAATTLSLLTLALR